MCMYMYVCVCICMYMCMCMCMINGFFIKVATSINTIGRLSV